MLQKVIGYLPYSFEGKDGNKVQGIKVYSIDESSEQDNLVGHKTVDITLPIELLKHLDGAPAIYDVTYEVVPTKGNKAKIIYKSIKKVRDLKLD